MNLTSKGLEMKGTGKKSLKLRNNKMAKRELMVILICSICFYVLIIGLNAEQLVTFLLGEAKLEQYLEENPPYEHNASKAKLGLTEAKQLLTLSAGKDRTRATGSMDAQLLLAKLHFSCG